mgnify:CR=1 FL=1
MKESSSLRWIAFVRPAVVLLLFIDYSLKKVEQEGKSEYLVFFKAKDVDVMTAAFKEL